MGLKDELEKEVSTTFSSQWTKRDGTVVPSDDTIKLTNDAVKLEGTVLYADMADSTKMVDNTGEESSAETYKTFLHCSAKIIRSEGGTITAYDGDRVMAVFLGDNKNTSAVRAALKIKWAATNIINPAKKKIYPQNAYPLRHVVGIDTSPLFVANAGVRGAKDLVWIGRAANHAAKLSALPASYSYITKAVYDKIAKEAKFSGETNMWTAVTWNTFNNATIYRSAHSWQIT